MRSADLARLISQTLRKRHRHQNASRVLLARLRSNATLLPETDTQRSVTVEIARPRVEAWLVIGSPAGAAISPAIAVLPHVIAAGFCTCGARWRLDFAMMRMGWRQALLFADGAFSPDSSAVNHYRWAVSSAN